MAIIARQFARPRGLLGRVVGRGMGRRNGDFSRWTVHEVSHEQPDGDARVVEIGPGPGIGLEEILKQFSRAHVWGVDLSPEMLSQSRKRNVAAVRSNRLSLIKGDSAALAGIAPVDVIVANHVLYFWHQPDVELTQLHGFLRPGGRLALGYQLRTNMPPMAQKFFPQQGHLLYDSESAVDSLLRAAGFVSIDHRLKGPPEAPEGRLALARA